VAQAAEPLSVEIVGAGASQIPIAIAPLASEPLLTEGLSDVVAADLNRSGLFRLIDASAISPRPADIAQLNVAEWRNRGTDAMLIGRVNPLPGGKLEIQVRLVDLAKGSQLLGLSYSIEGRQVRTTAHKIADAVFEKLTGVPGVFSTRIAYVTRQAKRFELLVADADGFNPKPVFTSAEPIISPRWSPDGGRLAYVSFERKKPVVVVQTLNNGQRQVVADFRGSNSAPAWSPDGSRLAVTLTRDGSSQIYVMPATGGVPERLMKTSPANDTEAMFSADGKFIFFTSDRGGGPQVYRIPAAGGAAERITFAGSYNISPTISPDGRTLAYVSRESNAFRLYVQDLTGGTPMSVSDTSDDESPSFAPNSRSIIYASRAQGRDVLLTTSLDGKIKSRLVSSMADVREPVWGPYGR
jgi:TolB protein